MRKGILVIYFGNEQIHLGKEQNSSSIPIWEVLEALFMIIHVFFAWFLWEN